MKVMDKDHDELIEYLDEKFGKTNTELADIKVDVRDLKQDMAELKESVRSLIDSINGLTKAIGDYHQEQVALSAKVDQHEKWINQIAKQVGIELKT